MPGIPAHCTWDTRGCWAWRASSSSRSSVFCWSNCLICLSARIDSCRRWWSSSSWYWSCSARDKGWHCTWEGFRASCPAAAVPFASSSGCNKAPFLWEVWCWCTWDRSSDGMRTVSVEHRCRWKSDDSSCIQSALPARWAEDCPSTETENGKTVGKCLFRIYLIWIQSDKPSKLLLIHFSFAFPTFFVG